MLPAPPCSTCAEAFSTWNVYVKVGEPLHAPGSHVTGLRSTGVDGIDLITGGEVSLAATGGVSLPSMKSRISGAAMFVKTSGTPSVHPVAPKSTMPTCTAGLPSVNGPPLSPWHVEELGEPAHSSTAELSPTPPRHASLLIAVSVVE